MLNLLITGYVIYVNHIILQFLTKLDGVVYLKGKPKLYGLVNKREG